MGSVRTDRPGRPGVEEKPGCGRGAQAVAVSGGSATHPFKFYLDFGIRVTINTDNRLITDTTVTKELSIVSRQFGLDVSDIRNIVVAGFKSAFLTFHDRAQLVRKAQNEMDEIIRQFAERNGAPKPAPVKAPASRPPAAKRA